MKIDRIGLENKGFGVSFQ